MSELSSGSSTIKYGILPIEVAEKLPTPEEVFNVSILNKKNLIFYVLGPSMIALGNGIGGGEWLLGTQAAVKYGLGVMWIAMLSMIFQVIYNVNIGRVIAYTGESPIVFFRRVPPGPTFWSIFLLFLIITWGMWGLAGMAGSTGTALGSIILGRLPTAAESWLVRSLGVLMILVGVLILMIGHKVERTLEIFNWVCVAFILLSLIFIVAPFTLKPETIFEAVWGSFNFGYIPPGADMSLITAWWAYAGLSAGWNFIYLGWYRDKGYGMGAVVGFIPALIGGKKVMLSPMGKIFKTTPENISTFKKWIRILQYDQWIIFFPGAILGMYLPAMIASSLLPRGSDLPSWGVAAHIASQYARIVGTWGYYFIGIIGFLIMYTTVLSAYMDVVPRNTTDVLWTLKPVRDWAKGDVRKVYYMMVAVFVALTIIALFVERPLVLLIIAANIANASTLFAVPVIIYLTRRMPKDVMPKVWEYIILVIFLMFSTYFLIFALLRTFGIL